MAQYANAVISKARAMYGQMLSPAQYDDLLRKQNVQEISAYLREKTPYRAALEGVQDSTIHRRQLENLLHRDLFYQYVRLAKYVREKDSIYQYIVMDLEIELILSSLRNIISDEQEDFVASLPTFMQPYASFNILGLAGARSLDEVIEAVAGTVYEPVLRRCRKQYPPDGNTLRYTRYELALRTCYFSTLLERAKRETRGRASAELRELITMRAELMNLNTIYRMKTYFQADADRIRVTMLPFYSRLRPRQLEEMVSARDTQAFLKLLSATPYGRRIDPETGFFEGETDGVRYRATRRLLRFSTSPEVVYTAFMLLRSMETEDIVRIIEGVRYGLPPEKIEKLLYKA